MPPKTKTSVGMETVDQTVARASALSPTISAKDLTTPMTQPKLSEPIQPVIPSRTTGTVKNVATNTQDFLTAQSEEAQRVKELRDQYAALGTEPTLTSVFDSKASDYGATPEAIKELKDIQLQLTDMDTGSEMTKTKIEGAAGQTLGQSQREVTQEDRENAVRRSGLAARAAVLQGNIETARSLAKDAVDIAYQDRSLKNQNLINQITDLQGVVDEQTAQLLEKEKRGYEADQAALKDLKDNIASAMLNGASQSEMAQLNDPTMDDASKLALAQQITARGSNQMRNLSIAEKNASIANTYDQIADRGARLKLAQEAAATEIDLATAAESEVKVAKADKALGILTSINELMVHPGLTSAVGPNFLYRTDLDTKRRGPGATIRQAASGERAEFISQVELLANSLTLENMGLLKGPATDKDVEIVANSVSRLKNRDVSEESYIKEFERLKAAAQRIVNNVGVTPEQAQFWYGADAESVSEADALWNQAANSTQQIGSSLVF